MKTDGQARYRVLVMTFWLEENDSFTDPDTWRFRVEEPKSKSRQGCIGLEKLLVLLTEKIMDRSVQRDE